MGYNHTFTEKPTVLIVDDAPENLRLLSGLLKGRYKVKIANNGRQALDLIASGKPPDIILLDVLMPLLDGHETCRHLKTNPNTAGIPVIFLTGKSDVEDEARGLELGAVDYIIKPISPPIVIARIQTHLQLKKFHDKLRDKNEVLETEVRRHTEEINAIQEVTIQALACLAETRDSGTGNHVRRTQFYIRALAERLRMHPRFKSYLNQDRTIPHLFQSTPLHDVGKVGIPDSILLKPGRYTSEEYEIMKNHTVLGRNAIQSAEKRLGSKVPFLTCAKEIAYSHHEKWDGSGYPEHLAGDAIPIPGRLMALADVYDAVVSARTYRVRMKHENAVRILRENAGSQFDPDIVEAFQGISGEFQQIAGQFEDKGPEQERKINRKLMSHQDESIF